MDTGLVLAQASRLLDNTCEAENILLVVDWELRGGKTRAKVLGRDNCPLQATVELLEITEYSMSRHHAGVGDTRQRLRECVNDNLPGVVR